MKQYDPVRPRSLVKPDAVAKRDYLAETLADQLNDRKSLGCYRVLAQKIPPAVLLETLAIVKDQRNDGAVHTRPGALFVALIKRYAQQQGIALGFQSAADLTARSTADLMDSSDPNHPHAARFARLLAAKVPELVIRQVLAEVKADDAQHPAKLFTHKMKRYALQQHKQRLGE